jgi:hypothetical protein
MDSQSLLSSVSNILLPVSEFKVPDLAYYGIMFCILAPVSTKPCQLNQPYFSNSTFRSGCGRVKRFSGCAQLRLLWFCRPERL